eukprot:COSAG02_NODE_5044_length_4700_cov_1.930015_1_plen_164_part_00
MVENGTSDVERYHNPISELNESQEGDSEEQPPSPTATTERTEGKGKIPKRLKKIPSIDLNLGSGDLENGLASGISAGLSKVGRRTTTDENAMPTPDPKVTEAMLRAAFDKIDVDGSMELDKEEVRLAAAEVGATWNDHQLEQVCPIIFAPGSWELTKKPTTRL